MEQGPEAGGRTPGRMKEGCLGRLQEEKNAKARKGREFPRWQINETNGKNPGSLLDPQVNERKSSIQHRKIINPYMKSTTVNREGLLPELQHTPRGLREGRSRTRVNQSCL